MSCWNTLCIEPTTDKFAIKKAYASQLKTRKPDEDPEGFAILHAHYKQALKSKPHTIEANKPQNIVPASVIETLRAEKFKTEQNIIEQLKAELSKAEQPIIQYIHETLCEKHTVNEQKTELELDLETSKAFSSELNFEAEWRRLKVKIDHILNSPKRANNINSWSFLDDSEALFDIEFKAYVSSYVFEQLLSLDCLPLHKQQAIAKVLTTFFRWPDRRDLLETQFGYKKVLQLLGNDKPEDKQKASKWVSEKYHYGPIICSSYSRKLASTSIDIGLIAIAQYYLALIISVVGFEYFLLEYALIRGFLMYLVLVPFFEASSLQGTPGKYLLDIKVTNLKGRRLNIFHASWRNLCFLLSTAGFKLTLWINIFSKDGKLLHDRFSRSIVIKR